jgi:hypothetical protein
MWNSEVAKNAHNKARRKLAQEAADRAEQEIADARRDLRQADNKARNLESNRRINMVANGLTPRLNAVMSTWGLRLPISLSAAERISAYTDFHRIVVNYDKRLNTFVKTEDGKRVHDDLSPETLRQISAETRGLFYHEVGHVLFSIPLPELLTLGWIQGWSHDAAKNSRLTTYQPENEDAENNQAWPVWAIDPSFHHAWNALEDQRMEMALVEESPHLANYLSVLVLRRIIGHTREQAGAWSLVAGRKYLPAATRREALKMWKRDPFFQRIDPKAVQTAVERYQTATTVLEMLDAVAEFHSLMTPDGGEITDGGWGGHGWGGEGQGEAPRPNTTNKIEETGDKNEGEPLGGFPGKVEDDAPGEAEEDDEADEEGSKDSDEDGEGGSKDSDDEDEGSHRPTSPDDAGHGHVEEANRWDNEERDRRQSVKEIQDDLQDTLDDLSQDEAVNDDLKAMNDAYTLDPGTLPAYPGRDETLQDDVLVSDARVIIDDLIRAFELANADSAPHWESGQRRGVLEPIRYRTRQPGDMEFFRQYTEAGDPGNDMAVSIFLDVSLSMDGFTEKLGAAAWASKVACEHIGIPCDVTLFDDGAWNLWGVDEIANDCPTVGYHGGTNPQAAFDAVLDKERPQKHHLVLIMTDGAWTDNDVLKRHPHDNMHSMVFYFNTWSGGESMEPYPALAKKVSADEAYKIGDLFDIPRALEAMLVGMG